MMEGSGRRISAANPRPCSGRRILAAKKRGRSDGFLNSVKKLQRREISSKSDRSFSITNAQERFRNMRLMVVPYSLYYSSSQPNFVALFFNHRNLCASAASVSATKRFFLKKRLVYILYPGRIRYP